MARESYATHAGSYWYTLRLQAIDNLTLETVSCKCPVVGVWKQTLAVLQNGMLRAVGESHDSDNLSPTHVELVQGEPLRVISQRVAMRGRSVQWLLNRIDTRHTYYISGKLRLGRTQAAGMVETARYNPVWFSGKALTLSYARLQDLEAYRNLVAAEGEVIVQFRLKLGEDAVEWSGQGDGKKILVPEVLRGYL